MYTDDLEKHLKTVIAEKKLTTYDELFKRSRGAFPDVVYELVKNNYPLAQGTNKFRRKQESKILPEPNPVNYDWRFDRVTILKITRYLKSKNFKRIAFFGTPSLFFFMESAASDVTLFDINETLLDFFENDKRIIITDINNANFEDFGKFDCVIMDPPWYLLHYKNWIYKANAVLEPNGEMLITLFQDLLRPEAKNEIGEIVNTAKIIGPVVIKNDFIKYKTPKFEIELFKELNIPCFDDWRIADMLVVTKKNLNVSIQPDTIVKDEWIRIILDGHLIAVKDDKKNTKITIEYPYLNNDSAIKSVSERDTQRKKLNLITSQNHGLIVSGTDKIIELLKGLSQGAEYKNLITNLKISPEETLELNKLITVL